MSRIAWVVTRPMRSSFRTCSMRSDALSSSRRDRSSVEYAARVGQADDHNVPRVRDLFAKEHFHDAELHLALGPAVDGRVAPGTEHPQVALVMALQDAVVYQPG